MLIVVSVTSGCRCDMMVAQKVTEKRRTKLKLRQRRRFRFATDDILTGSLLQLIAIFLNTFIYPPIVSDLSYCHRLLFVSPP